MQPFIAHLNLILSATCGRRQVPHHSPCPDNFGQSVFKLWSEKKSRPERMISKRDLVRRFDFQKSHCPAPRHIARTVQICSAVFNRAQQHGSRHTYLDQPVIHSRRETDLSATVHAAFKLANPYRDANHSTDTATIG